MFRGDLYHIWHGDIDKRQYLKRIQDFTTKTKQIIHKDENGLYVTHAGDDEYMKKYFKHREVTSENEYLSSMDTSYSESSGNSSRSDSLDQAILANEVLNDRNETSYTPSEFGEGQSGGGGAGGSWDESSSSSQVVQSDNFS
ncbi:MAG: hypothetical protein IPG24_09150 [Leptospiraceae bacterium]|nr:hypothetical protein [Leptospiraceae bacterium]